MAKAQFRFTTGRWYNKYDPETDRTAKAPAYRQGFSYDSFAYGSDTPEDFTPPAPAQISLITARQTLLVVPDVDYPENLPAAQTGQLLSWSDAVSTRGTHFHAGIDMTGAPPGLWPAQGRTAWGDVKSNGFVAAPGSTHYSGEQYAPAENWPAKLVPWTPELLAALEQDKLDYRLTRLNEARTARGLPAGGTLPTGEYEYASGYVGGTWEQLPDGFLTHDDELKDLVHDMHVIYGAGEEECRAQWLRLAGATGAPWTERDLARHWRQLPGKRAVREDEENWYESFSLKPAEPPVQAAARVQREQYEERAASPSGFGPPTAPPPGGFEVEGVDYMPLWLGAGVFDAGRPTDADNALAVLRRAVNVLRLDEESDSWLVRDTGCWRHDDDAPLAVIMTLRDLLPEGLADPEKALGLDKETDSAQIYALKCQAKNLERFSTASSAAAISRLMKAVALQYRQAGGTMRAGTLDCDPEILWAGGVPWDLARCGAGPVPAALDRNTPHLLSTPVIPDASVDTPVWDELLGEVWVDSAGRPDPDLAAWAVLVSSAGATGYPKKVIPVLKGGTDRGKSTFIDALADILGTYFGPLNPKVLDAGTTTHDTVLMELKGRRMAFLDEGVKRNSMATTRLKRLAGGSAITANRMRQDPVTFKPTHTLVITLNPEDSFSFEDPAVDSRIRLLPCDGNPERVVPVAKKLNYFKSPAWLAERPGVLAKLMRAAAQVLADDRALNKDRAPMAVQVAEQGVRDEEDDVLRWFMEATADCPEGYGSRELFISFREWTRETKGDRGFIPSETKWGLRMNELVPEDVDHKLVTANKSRLRRRKPRQPGGYGPAGGSGGLAATGFSGQSQDAVETISPVVIHNPTVSDPSRPGGSSPAEPTYPPGNSPDTKDQVRLRDSVSTVGTVGYSPPLSNTENTPPTTPAAYIEKGTGETHRATGPAGDPPAGPFAPGAALHLSEGEPEATNRSFLAENGEKAEKAKNRVTPPGQKNPGGRLTEEEKAARAAAKKELAAQQRAEARTAKVAELGGPLVQLPAIVLRDQSILPCTSEQAAAFLQGCLGELSVDVEHSGFPRMHKDYALRLVQLGSEHAAVVLDPSDPAQAEVVRGALRDAQVLHAHSALADLIPLEAAGLCDASVWDRMQDSVLLAKLTDPALCDSDEAGLKALAKALLGPDYALSWKAEELKNAIFAAGGWLIECEVTTPAERSGWANIPLCEAFVRYSAADVMDCSAVWAKLMERNQ